MSRHPNTDSIYGSTDKRPQTGARAGRQEPGHPFSAWRRETGTWLCVTAVTWTAPAVTPPRGTSARPVGPGRQLRVAGDLLRIPVADGPDAVLQPGHIGLAQKLVPANFRLGSLARHPPRNPATDPGIGSLWNPGGPCRAEQPFFAPFPALFYPFTYKHRTCDQVPTDDLEQKSRFEGKIGFSGWNSPAARKTPGSRPCCLSFRSPRRVRHPCLAAAHDRRPGLRSTFSRSKQGVALPSRERTSHSRHQVGPGPQGWRAFT